MWPKRQENKSPIWKKFHLLISKLIACSVSCQRENDLNAGTQCEQLGMLLRLLAADSGSHGLQRDCCCRGQDASRSPFLVVLYWDHSVAGLLFLLVWLFLTLSIEMEEMPRAEESFFSVIQISRCTTGVLCWPGLWYHGICLDRSLLQFTLFG